MTAISIEEERQKVPKKEKCKRSRVLRAGTSVFEDRCSARHTQEVSSRVMEKASSLAKLNYSQVPGSLCPRSRGMLPAGLNLTWMPLLLMANKL